MEGRALRRARAASDQFKKEDRRRKTERQNDPTKRAAKKARTEAKALQVPSDYTGIRAGSVYFAVEASVGGEKKLFAGR
jgi:hypothetical protein